MKLSIILKGVALSVFMGFISTIFIAVILGILNLYLVGREIYIFEEKVEWGLFAGGLDDAILLILVSVVAATTFVIYVSRKRRVVKKVSY